jgi:hypothetical protein
VRDKKSLLPHPREDFLFWEVPEGLASHRDTEEIKRIARRGKEELDSE